MFVSGSCLISLHLLESLHTMSGVMSKDVCMPVRLTRQFKCIDSGLPQSPLPVSFLVEILLNLTIPIIFFNCTNVYFNQKNPSLCIEPTPRFSFFFFLACNNYTKLCQHKQIFNSYIIYTEETVALVLAKALT